MLVIAAGISLASRGPLIFRQERVGYRGRLFMCLKFRSMRCDADVRVHKEHLSQIMKSGAPMIKLDRADDPRLIPYGDLLRASGLDELPQIFNVLKGDMSLVGPRPCTSYEYDQYLPWQKERFEVLPGLTGLWQVTGKNKTTFDEMVRLDIQYRRELSVACDVAILSRTFGVLLQQVGESSARRIEKARTLLFLPKTKQENG
jgi:lipopolysaccharide/colanic/teichoic acid biosynthesis glycosyltransferase